jgi:acetyl-CoA acetyltransferase
MSGSGTNVGIRGIGETHYLRKSGRTLDDLQATAIRDALSDAELSSSDIDAVVTDCAIMPLSYSVDKAISQLGLRNVRHVGTFSTGLIGLNYGLDFARSLVLAGKASNVLFYFGVDWGSATGNAYSYHERFPMKLQYELPYGFYGQPVYYATYAQRYAYDYELSAAELAEGLGDIAINSRYNASLNKHAQEQSLIDMDDYLASPLIADPLRKLDCSLLTDGAGAFVVSAVDGSWAHDPVLIRGVSHAQQVIDDQDFYTQNPRHPQFPASALCMENLLRETGMSRSEIDILEIYDCFTISLVLQLESLGFCEPGDGIHAGSSGRTRVDGAMPVNTHGGLLSQGYMLGMNHLIEAVRQLRHEAGEAQVPGARTALVAGAPTREYSVALLSRAQ